MAGSLSPTPPPISDSEDDDAASRGSKELSPTQGTQRSSRSPSVGSNLPPTRAELDGYSSLLGSLALRDANAFAPRLLGTPLWSPTPRLSEAGSSPDRLLGVSRRNSGLIPTPRVPESNQRRQLLRQERAKLHASFPQNWQPEDDATPSIAQIEEDNNTLWPEQPGPLYDAEPLDEVVAETAFDMVAKERLKLPREPKSLAVSTTVKPRDESGRFVPASDSGDDEEDEEEDIELDSGREDDHELPPDIAQHIAHEVKVQIDRTLATLAACRPPATEKKRDKMQPMDWRAVLSAVALTVDQAVIDRVTGRLNVIFDEPDTGADELLEHRQRIVQNAIRAPELMVLPKDDVFARTRFTESRIKRVKDTSAHKDEKARRKAQKKAQADALAAVREGRALVAKRKRSAATRAAERKRVQKPVDGVVSTG